MKTIYQMLALSLTVNFVGCASTANRPLVAITLHMRERPPFIGTGSVGSSNCNIPDGADQFGRPKIRCM